jgi:hypothetical protein
LIFGAGITPDMIVWNGLGFDVGTQGDSFELIGNGGPAVQNFQFADGTVLNYAQLLAWYIVPPPPTGNAERH